MGIRGLTSLIKKYIPEAITVNSLKYYQGSTIAIDTSILLYKFRYSNSKPNSHISGFLHKCMTYMKNGIIPIFVFDGKPPPEKNNTIKKRFKQRQKLEQKIKLLKEQIDTIPTTEEKECILNQIKKLNKQMLSVTKEHHIESRNLLTYLGFRVINSPGEAEEVCSSLQRCGAVDFTFSDDTDVLVLGCDKVLRSCSNNNNFMEIELNKILNGLDIDIDQFIDMCILCGCDYCSTIPKVNYDVAYKLIKKYKNIENIITSGEIKEVPYNFNFENARKIFKNQSDNNDRRNTLNYKLPPIINEDRLISFLLEKKFNKKYILNYIRKFKHSYNVHMKQTVKNTTSNKDFFQIIK